MFSFKRFLACAIAFGLGLMVAAPAHAWTQRTSGPDAEILVLEKGRSAVVEADRPFSTLVVADPDVAEAMATSNRSFFLRGKLPGAAHCADMPYLFGPLPEADAESILLAQTEQDYLFNFIKKSDPNGPNLTGWPQTGPGNHLALVLASEAVSSRDLGNDALLVWFAKWKSETGRPIVP